MAFPTLPSLRFDGRRALIGVIEQSEYRSLAQAVASLTVFAHPDTVAQTRGLALFRTVRRRQQEDVGVFGEVVGCDHRIMFDDNRSPGWALRMHAWHLGAAGRAGQSPVAEVARAIGYTSLANLCLTPAFLAKLTDTDERVRTLLRCRAFALFGYWPGDTPHPQPPAGYRG